MGRPLPHDRDRPPFFIGHWKRSAMHPIEHVWSRVGFAGRRLPRLSGFFLTCMLIGLPVVIPSISLSAVALGEEEETENARGEEAQFHQPSVWAQAQPRHSSKARSQAIGNARRRAVSSSHRRASPGLAPGAGVRLRC
jgi:hypothetical protein